jgi:hypothetical protein
VNFDNACARAKAVRKISFWHALAFC